MTPEDHETDSAAAVERPEKIAFAKRDPRSRLWQVTVRGKRLLSYRSSQSANALVKYINDLHEQIELHPESAEQLLASAGLNVPADRTKN